MKEGSGLRTQTSPRPNGLLKQRLEERLYFSVAMGEALPGPMALLLVAPSSKWQPGRAAAPSQPQQPRPRRQNVPNELVKHLYNFSSVYKEGLLYTIYTWR